MSGSETNSNNLKSYMITTISELIEVSLVYRAFSTGEAMDQAIDHLYLIYKSKRPLIEIKLQKIGGI